MNYHLWGVFALTLGCTVVRCILNIEKDETDQFCEQAFENASFRQCCDIPRFLPDDVVELCRKRPTPSVPPGVAEPIPANCMAECALNVTRILMNNRFRVQQARKVLMARTGEDTEWAQAIGNAIDKCYLSEVARAFFLQDVAQNKISPLCLPSSVRFLECTFALTYRDCPNKYWHDPNETCISLIMVLNTCSFFFRGNLDSLQ